MNQKELYKKDVASGHPFPWRLWEARFRDGLLDNKWRTCMFPIKFNDTHMRDYRQKSQDIEETNNFGVVPI